MYQRRYQGMSEHTRSPLRGSVLTAKKRRKFVINWDTSNHILQAPYLHTFLTAIITFILLSALRQVHSLFQSEFFIQCDRLHLSFIFQYLLFSLRSSSSYLRLLPRHHVTTTLLSIFPSITCFRRQFLLKM